MGSKIRISAALRLRSGQQSYIQIQIMEKKIIKEYKKKDITVIWKAHKCIHSANCVKGLNEVFNPKERPWIKMENGKTQEIVETVDSCPSGALSYKLNNPPVRGENDQPEVKVKLVPLGPVKIVGFVKFINDDGKVEIVDDILSICRCGLSKDMPWCDGEHKKLDAYKELHKH